MSTPSKPNKNPSAKGPLRAEKDLSKEEKIAAFLKAGGKIQQIPTGVSGQENSRGSKHITLGGKPKS